jgi:arginase
MAGDPNHPAAQGPATLTAALVRAGYRQPADGVAIPEFDADSRAASLQIVRRLAERVREVAGRGDFPMVLAGSCDVAAGVLAGIRDRRVGVIWIDAHADFNTPASSTSGFWPGMALAVVVGDCGEEVWRVLDWHPVDAERVALLGTRSLSPPEESRRLAQSEISVLRWRHGGPEGKVATLLERLATHVEGVYVHLDLDALDPSIGSGVVDPPVPGGLSARQLTEILGDIRQRFSVVGASVTTYTPARDDGSTLPVATAAIRTLIDPER